MKRKIALTTLLTAYILSSQASAFTEGFYNFSNNEQQANSSDYSDDYSSNSNMLNLSKCTVELQKKALGKEYHEKSGYYDFYLKRSDAVTLCLMPKDQRECYKEQITADFDKVRNGYILFDTYIDICGVIKNKVRQN